MMLRERLKWLLFPGLDLHARLRYRVLSRRLGSPRDGQPLSVLDAGCGNGMLSYQSHLRGNRVLGVTIKEEVIRNRRLFNQWLRIPEERLSFRDFNLYALDQMGEQFDEIICSEVLEHIRDDERICRNFFQVLNPGGVLHLCCPNARHPDNASWPLDPHEKGGHVRAGYTFEDYERLLEPIGFHIEHRMGLGGPLRQSCNRPIVATQERFGLAAGLALFGLLWPISCLDRDSPSVPFSIYVLARKPI